MVSLLVMRKSLFIFLFVLMAQPLLFAQMQAEQIAAIKNRLNNPSLPDTTRYRIYFDLSQGYRFSNVDSAIDYIDRAIALAQHKQIGDAVVAEAFSQKGFVLLETGDLPLSLQYQFESLGLSQKANAKETEAFSLNRIGNIYMELGEYKKANEYYRKATAIFTTMGKTGYIYNELSNIGNVYELMGEADSADFYQQQVYQYSLTNTDRYAITYGEMRERMGNIARDRQQYDTALMHYRIAIKEATIDNDYRNLASNYLQIAKVFHLKQQPDSELVYATKAIETAKSVTWKRAITEASGLLHALYKEKQQPDSALKYAEVSATYKDSLYGQKKFRQIQLVMLGEQQRQQQLIEERNALQQRYRFIAFSSIIAVIVLIAAILYRNSRREHRANLQLQAQKEQITQQKNNLEQTLGELKAAQTQLIHAEKMASLGELTAGIAHEIQNPLNFVNNFSEINNELIEEIRRESSMVNSETGLLVDKEILNDIYQNNEKITHHGKRADAIVKGMLQHSRKSTSEKEPTDINALADEYLRLAYHGLRAKDKGFNATLKTEFDSNLSAGKGGVGKIKINPQETGRVLLNLYNNAFYAINEKQKALTLRVGNAATAYEPTLIVSTKKMDKSIEIKVADNGNGIPQSIIDKIFQPFFTTKPTGQGTGLGLSLAYDIITKEHNGTIQVKSKEGEGTIFIIELPV
ncbi:MAG: ATP-binding protein [Bacteroidota bacterium]